MLLHFGMLTLDAGACPSALLIPGQQLVSELNESLGVKDRGGNQTLCVAIWKRQEGGVGQ